MPLIECITSWYKHGQIMIGTLFNTSGALGSFAESGTVNGQLLSGTFPYGTGGIRVTARAKCHVVYRVSGYNNIPLTSRDVNSGDVILNLGSNAQQAYNSVGVIAYPIK